MKAVDLSIMRVIFIIISLMHGKKNIVLTILFSEIQNKISNVQKFFKLFKIIKYSMKNG